MSERGWSESGEWPHGTATGHVGGRTSPTYLSTPYAPVSTGNVIRVFESAEVEQAQLLHAHWPELAHALTELLRANGRGTPAQWHPR